VVLFATVLPVTQEALNMDLLTTREVAVRLHVSHMTVIRLHDAGDLPGVEVLRDRGRRTLRFRPEAVQNFIEKRERSSQEISK
jgi:excisionase family DNA binding protein